MQSPPVCRHISTPPSLRPTLTAAAASDRAAPPLFTKQVIKKVREHHRKKRKELKKLGKRAPKEKDPGIPAQWPFKEELIKELAWKRQQILLEEKAKKEERRKARQVRAGAVARAVRVTLRVRACVLCALSLPPSRPAV